MSQELKLRIISALVLAFIILGATWLGGIYFIAIAQAIALLVYYEWTSITKARSLDPHSFWAGWIIVVAVSLRELSAPYFALPGYVFEALVAVVFIYALVRCRNYWNIGGIIYACLTGVSMAAIRADDLTGFVAMLFVFAIVWGTDIAAYFTGRAIGGPKLAPSISPGKTWSGAIGGAVAAVICGCLLVLFYLRDISGWIIGISLLLSVLSQIGDLFESFMKRRYKVKDSSHLIPGHGGVMDRIDGLAFACFGAFLLKVVMASADVGVGGFLLGAFSF
jgi:phosphatidate cytidylyltransferase